MVVRATSVEKPRTAEELAGLLREASASRSIVMPVGGGRARGMGGPGPGVDVELHTSRLDRMLEHSQADMVVSVEAGITLEALQHELGKARQFLPLDPFNSPGHTIGGLLATGWTGPLRLRYGSARDFLIGIRVALPDGKLASAGGRVVKNVSGYDLMKLHHGALGTLGVIVAASFKVFPKPLHDATVESDGGWLGAERALSTPVAPVAVEVFNDGRVLARFMGSPDAVKRALAELGWAPAPQTVWRDHSLRAPESWARISAPRHALRELVQALPPGAEWWASPGVGVAHWSIDSGPETVRQVRAAAEAAGGALVLMNAPAELVQAVGAWGSPPETLGVMRRLKDSFDPEGVLNAGRFVF
jgi:glycolate oxidase FAD binding subunit